MCDRPEVLSYDGRINPVPVGPVRCATCGGELRLVCVRDETHQSLPDANQVQPRQYRRKPCARCLRTFQPTGPRSLYCDRDDCTTIHPEA